MVNIANTSLTQRNNVRPSNLTVETFNPRIVRKPKPSMWLR